MGIEKLCNHVHGLELCKAIVSCTFNFIHFGLVSCLTERLEHLYALLIGHHIVHITVHN